MYLTDRHHTTTGLWFAAIPEKLKVMKVDIINKKNNSGQVTFEYKDLDQLNRLIEVIKVNN